MSAVLEAFTANGYTYDAKSLPPSFGHGLKKYWAFEQGFINLNHGSFGSLPLPVFAASVKYQLESELNPDKFHRITYFPLGIESRELLADFIGVKTDEVVLVPNTTHGINTWCRLSPTTGFIASTTYGAVVKTIQYLSDMPESRRPTTYSLELTFPMTHTQIVENFRTRIRELKQQHTQTFEFLDTPDAGPTNARVKNKFVAVIDSIVSGPGVLLPWQELVRVCREEGVWSVVDAAHSLGQEVDINLSKSRPDFWVSNAHKWLYVKRGCAVLYAPERHQHIIKSSIPTSHMYKEAGALWRPDEIMSTFASQHEYNGTLDFTPYITVKPALAFRTWLGGEYKINTYCHELAVAGGKCLASILGTEVLDSTGELTLNMTNVRLPLPKASELPPGVTLSKAKYRAVDNLLRDRLLNDWNVYAAHFFHADAWWVRCSAQVWNEISDFEYLGTALVKICPELEEVMKAQEGSVAKQVVDEVD